MGVMPIILLVRVFQNVLIFLMVILQQDIALDIALKCGMLTLLIIYVCLIALLRILVIIQPGDVSFSAQKDKFYSDKK
jgi:hypothetical protein